MELRGRRVIVVGLGTSGEAAARILVREGAEVWVTEARRDEGLEERAARLAEQGVQVEIGGHSFHEVSADLAVVSPGIRPDAPILAHLERQGVRIISEIELAYWLIRQPIIAVTGTNGKTTTTALIAKMIEESGRATLAAGNIGIPLIEVPERVEGDDAVIAAEVSSFQLWGIETFRPRVAVLLNIAEDHIDWHGSLEEYARAKARIFENQEADDAVIFNADDALISRMVEGAPSRKVPFSSARALSNGMGVDGERVMWRGTSIFSTADIPLAGAAGTEDALAAAAAVLEAGIEVDAIIRALKAFEPLSHRVQPVAESGGIRYINDSKATNPHATLAAVRGLENVVLIAGGLSKGIDLSPLKDAVPPVIAVIALGDATPELERVFAHAVPVERATDMNDAVRRAQTRSIAPGSVLLAPACASLDMYENYAARGDAFVDAVRKVLGLRDERGADGNA